MNSSGCLVILFLSIIGYIIGIAGLVAGVLGTAWFVYKPQPPSFKLGSSHGLIKECNERINGEGDLCTDRKEVLKFKEDDSFSKEKDVVLMLLIVSMVLCFIAILLSLVMICYRRRKASWRCAAICAFTFGLFATILGIASLGYAESAFKDIWSDIIKHGWSNIVCWVGCGGMILGSILSILMVWVTPSSSSSDKNVGVHYVGNRNPTYQHDYNVGY